VTITDIHVPSDDDDEADQAVRRESRVA
jgi:hypothetical protein